MARKVLGLRRDAAVEAEEAEVFWGEGLVRGGLVWCGMGWGVGGAYGWVDAGEAWFALGGGGGWRGDGDGARLLLLGGAWGGARGGGRGPRRCLGGHCGGCLSRARRGVLSMFFVNFVRDGGDLMRLGRQMIDVPGQRYSCRWCERELVLSGCQRGTDDCQRDVPSRGNGLNPSSRRGTQLGKNKDVNWERKKDGKVKPISNGTIYTRKRASQRKKEENISMTSLYHHHTDNPKTTDDMVPPSNPPPSSPTQLHPVPSHPLPPLQPPSVNRQSHDSGSSFNGTPRLVTQPPAPRRRPGMAPPDASARMPVDSVQH